MKKTYLFPIAALFIVLSLSLWNSAAISAETSRWQSQLQTARLLAQDEDWSGASNVLEQCYADWTARQAWLHIVAQHEVVDDAEAMYQRSMAFASVEEPNEFQAEVADLQTQLRLLAEMEQFSIRNIL